MNFGVLLVNFGALLVSFCFTREFRLLLVSFVLRVSVGLMFLLGQFCTFIGSNVTFIGQNSLYISQPPIQVHILALYMIRNDRPSFLTDTIGNRS